MTTAQHLADLYEMIGPLRWIVYSNDREFRSSIQAELDALQLKLEENRNDLES